jgi:hypothetical protein
MDGTWTVSKTLTIWDLENSLKRILLESQIQMWNRDVQDFHHSRLQDLFLSDFKTNLDLDVEL